MAQNLISATLSAEDAAGVQQSLTDANSRLSFLLSLQTEDMATLFKVGNAYLPFIEKAYQAMVAHPEIVPQIFNQSEFVNDYQLLSTLRSIFNQINDLAESVQKTYQAVGSDSLVAALEVYSAVKQNNDKVPGLAATADEMAVFFKRTRVKTGQPK